MAKPIVVCFDGAARQIGAGNLTNVAKLTLRYQQAFGAESNTMWHKHICT